MSTKLSHPNDRVRGELLNSEFAKIIGLSLNDGRCSFWTLRTANFGPTLLSQADSVGQTVAAVHTTLGNVILWVAGLHAAAVLYHRFFLRDGVLVSILAGRWRS
jgi:cytochrome b561